MTSEDRDGASALLQMMYMTFKSTVRTIVQETLKTEVETAVTSAFHNLGAVKAFDEELLERMEKLVHEGFEARIQSIVDDNLDVPKAVDEYLSDNLAGTVREVLDDVEVRVEFR